MKLTEEKIMAQWNMNRSEEKFAADKLTSVLYAVQTCFLKKIILWTVTWKWVS